MRNKFLLIASIAIILALAGVARAEDDQSSNNNANKEKERNAEVRYAVTGTEATVEKKVEDLKSLDVTSTQEQAEEKENENATGTEEQDTTTTTEKGMGSARAQQRRSEVANAVHALLQVADRTSGIGEQVRVIAQNQNDIHQKAEDGLQKVESRSGFTKFFIGPDFQTIKDTQKLLEQNQTQIEALKQIQSKLTNTADQQALATQITTLEKSFTDLQNSLNDSQKGFSLLGWLFKQFVK